MSLPAGFRQELQRQSDHPPFLTNAHECLELFAYEDWVDFEERIVGTTSVDPEVQDYARIMISGATACPIDKQGRILVPVHLREHAGLEREVILAGVGRKIELWDKARFERNWIQTKARLPEMARSVATKLGM